MLLGGFSCVESEIYRRECWVPGPNECLTSLYLHLHQRTLSNDVVILSG
jgi:hypothetical protein